jgi:flavin reductase (DIM6/NTAB) family NADH-FMN oxidoreductase RutF
MTDRNHIKIKDFNTNVFDDLNKNWMLLTAGDFQSGDFNAMTVSWGFFGTFWHKPVVITGVRPQRHTLSFLEKYDSFTLCAFPPEFQENLNYCGTKSGKEVNKIQECGLTPIPGDAVNAPGFEQAELIIECKILYSDAMKGKCFLDKSLIKSIYPDRDFHRLFFGEVMKINGNTSYRKKKQINTNNQT